MQTETNENNPIFAMETKPEWTQADGMWLLRSIRATAETGSPVEASFLAKARRNLPCLREVPVEQKRKELLATLQGEYAGMALREYSDIWAEVIPELKTCFGFPQNSPYHPYNVWEHTVHAVESAPAQDGIVRLALLLHDIGKPLYYQEGSDGIRHFRGHGKISQEVAKRVLERLKFDRTTADAVTQLVGVHDRRVDATPEAAEQDHKTFPLPLFFVSTPPKKNNPAFHNRKAGNLYLARGGRYQNSLLGSGASPLSPRHRNNVSERVFRRQQGIREGQLVKIDPLCRNHHGALSPTSQSGSWGLPCRAQTWQRQLGRRCPGARWG